MMHFTEREKHILAMLKDTGFVTFRQLEKLIDASPATLRRDLERMAQNGLVSRVRGGAKLLQRGKESAAGPMGLQGTPFDENISRNTSEKKAIGKAAAALCEPGEGVMIDGGTTTFQMCPHLEGLELQVLTNSLHIVSALLPQTGTRILVPGGSVFREQNIILSAVGDECMPSFFGPKLFMGAASIGPQGLMQDDIILVAAERRLIGMADELIVLVDSSKFQGASGNVVCALDQITTLITDTGVKEKHVAFLEEASVKVITVPV
jgi:DeoR family ulaG and ulaABCDEF operon transcriptional repressor